MKASTLLTHVCLWYARIFVFWLLARTCVTVWHSVSGKSVQVFGAIPMEIRVWCFSILAIAVVWLVCLWSLKKSPARLFLRISAILFLLGTFAQNFQQIPTLRRMDPAYLPAILPGLLVVFFISVLGFAAMLWLSWHPPQKSIAFNAAPRPQFS